MVKFSRVLIGGGLSAARSRAGAVWFLALLLAGCAGPRQAALGPQSGGAAGDRLATVTAIRSVPRPAPQSGAVILAILGLGGQEPPAPLAEVLLRTDGGKTLSVVAPGGDGLRVGSRVVVGAEDHLRLVQPGGAVPAL